MTTHTTPVALFSYNRADHVGRALESLAQCRRLDECRLHLYCDGPKGDEDRGAVEASRRVVREWAVKLQATVIERPDNLGLARSIVTGVTDLCGQYGRVIVLEDDLVVSPDFLDYMLQALDRYQDAPQVYQISGYMFPVELPATTDAVFLPLTTTWGWATWGRAWQIFDWKATGALEALADPAVQRRFDLDGAYPYSSMLHDRLAGNNDSWGILWWWAVFRSEGRVLYPGRSLVVNEGFDGSGTHCREGGRLVGSVPVGGTVTGTMAWPSAVTVNTRTLARIKSLLRSRSSGGDSLIGRLRRTLAGFFLQ